ncbi:MAG: NUDIX hydrolase [Desulfobulbaceae bacterium]|nr:NUDIX hydrolase [Desulfobulbaceae bacterium]
MKNSKNNTEKSRWRVSTLRTLITTPVLKLLTSRVHCDRTGIEKDFFKLDFPRWVNIVACTSKNEIVLIRQYRFGTDRIEMEIPGGAVNDGEPPLEAGLRELLEETGYAGVDARIIGKVCPNPAIQDNICYTVLVENVKKVSEPTLDDMEDIEVLIMSEDDAFALIKDGTIDHGLVLNALMFYALARRRTIY